MTRRVLCRNSAPCILMIAILCMCQGAQCAPRVLWQIGKFDYSSSEFNHGSEGPSLFGARYPHGELIYIVGKSTPKTDWPAFQPGSANGRAGYRVHPYTIEFGLPEAPRGLYTLKVAVLVETPRIEQLQVTINGRRAEFYQRPQLSYAGGDRPMVVQPTSAADTIQVEIPTSYLKEGGNKLVLTAIDDTKECDNVTGSGFVCDALELEQYPDRTFLPAEIKARVVPTIFFERKAGQLFELLDVYVRLNAPSTQGTVVLSVGPDKFTKELSSGCDFGEQRFEFAVPQFKPQTKAEITIRTGGRTRSFPLLHTPDCGGITNQPVALH